MQISPARPASGEQLDAEDLRRVLTKYFAALDDEILRAGGRVDKYIGDAVLAIFGLPNARRGDAVRAVGAALEMQSAICLGQRCVHGWICPVGRPDQPDCSGS